MSEAQTPVGRKSWIGWAIGAAVVVGLAGVLYVTFSASIKPDDGRPRPATVAELEKLAVGQLKGMTVPAGTAPPPQTAVNGPDGQPVRFGPSDAVTVVNLWATWCAPCVTEMPSLARLQQAYPNGEVRVVPVSVDGDNKLEAAKAFIAQNTPLPFHHSPNAEFAWAVNATSFPTTIILDRRGVERARLGAPAEWDSADAKAVIDRLLVEPKS